LAPTNFGPEMRVPLRPPICVQNATPKRIEDFG